jgi:uncharacterized protein YcbX
VTVGRVSRIAIAPVKSLGLVHPESVELTHAGVPGDRLFALVDQDARLVSGKKQGPLVRVRPEVIGDSLRLTLPDGSVLEGDIELGAPVAAVFYGAERPARVVLGPFSAALSDFAGQELRLVRMPEGEGVDRTGDGVVTIQSSAALEAMAYQAGLPEPVDGRRFRMTFTVDDLAAHEEDSWLGRRVRIGTAVVLPAGNVGRCAITTHDPDTGIKSLDTLKLIAEARGHIPTTEPLPFGVHAEVVEPGHVAVGDEVEVLD